MRGVLDGTPEIQRNAIVNEALQTAFRPDRVRRVGP